MIGGYRRDIDGLRAVAIITVIAFHSGWTLFRTGFVGVDVFFVISGYLIGSMILDDVRAGRFSLAGFYERRVRRIFPALAVMLFGASLLASLYLLPGELEQFGKSLVAATFSFSNLYFAYALNGYFSPSGLSVPLLHTWSLAIEEQFYLFLPLFVLLVYRLKPRLLWPAVGLAALASFALSLHDGLSGVMDDFYLPHVRAWELLLGTLVACPHLRLPNSAALREALGLLGLGLIIAAVFLPLHGQQFPGYAAALPCGGTALAILAGREGETLVTRLICRGPVLVIGRISYSLYLWHWPIFSFMKLSAHFPHDQNVTATRLAAVGVTLIIGYLSWRFVENPFRYGPRRPSRRLLFGEAAATAGLLAILGIAANSLQGLPGRFGPDALAMAQWNELHAKADLNFRTGTCFLNHGAVLPALEKGGCLRSDPTRPNYLLLGDSYAAALWAGLAGEFKEINFMQATAAACTPLATWDSSSDTCTGLRAYIYGDYLLHHKPDRLVVTARWLDSDRPDLARILDWARQHGIRVIVIGPVVRYDDDLPRLLALSIQYRDPGLVDAHHTNLERLDADLRAITERGGGQYVSLLDVLCKNDVCDKYGADGVPLEFDIGHLTLEGARLAARRLREAGTFPVVPAAAQQGG